jgi:hypothetical protein
MTRRQSRQQSNPLAVLHRKQGLDWYAKPMNDLDLSHSDAGRAERSISGSGHPSEEEQDQVSKISNEQQRLSRNQGTNAKECYVCIIVRIGDDERARTILSDPA